MIAADIKKLILESLKELSTLSEHVFTVEHPAELSHGDYSTNVALVFSKIEKQNPLELAEKIKTAIEQKVSADAKLSETIKKVQVAGPGFINFFLTDTFFTNSLAEVLLPSFGTHKTLEGKTYMVEYTDPNPFKQFHIGHLMSNAIGEALSRIVECNGAKVIRACYGGDVGPHVAKAIWGMMQNKAGFPHDDDSLSDKVRFIGESYTYGSNAYEDNPQAQEEIKIINKKVFELFDETKKSDQDQELKIYYDKGKAWSIEHFYDIYKKLNTHFDHIIYESMVSDAGKNIVLAHPEIFEKSEGAIVFLGEKYGLHTRVFLNSQGLPTYEAKELGLFDLKKKLETFDTSIVITANEQDDYFKVVMKAIELLNPESKGSLLHVSHGMLRFKEGKMASRKGNIITGESLITDMQQKVAEKLADRNLSLDEKKKIEDQVAISAIKYVILKQAPGKNIIFDPETSLSFEGDSGPYLQYSYTRAQSVLRKAKEQGIIFEIESAKDQVNQMSKVSQATQVTEQIGELEKTLYRFVEVTSRAYEELSPQYITTFLIEIASAFNSYYANNQIITEDSTQTAYRLLITHAVSNVLKNGMTLLGMSAPEKM